MRAVAEDFLSTNSGRGEGDASGDADQEDEPDLVKQLEALDLRGGVKRH